MTVVKRCYACDKPIRDMYNKRKFKKYCVACNNVLKKEEKNFIIEKEIPLKRKRKNEKWDYYTMGKGE